MPLIVGICCLGIVITSLGLIGYLRHEDKPGLLRFTQKYLAELSVRSGIEPSHELEPDLILAAHIPRIGD